MKKVISVLLIILIVFSTFFTTVAAADTVNPKWKSLYWDYVDKYSNDSNHNSYRFWLIDFDNDKTPELVMDSGYGGSGMYGQAIVCYNNGNLQEEKFGGYWLKYRYKNKLFIEGQRRPINGDWEYYYGVYQINNSKATRIFNARAVTDNSVAFNNQKPNAKRYEYATDGLYNFKDTTFNDLQKKLNRVIDTNNMMLLKESEAYNYYQIDFGISVYNNIETVTPVVSLLNTSNGIYAKWQHIEGAFAYSVYYKKASDSNWTSTWTHNNYFQIPNCVSGTIYYVQISPTLAGSKYNYYSKVRSMTFLGQVKINTLYYNGNNTLSWNKVNGANNYQIARIKKGDSAFTYFTTNNNNFTEANAIGGTMYTYQVRAMYQTSNSGTAYGAWSSSKSVVTLVKPTVTLYSQSNAVLAKWNSIRGALKYVVYFKTAAATKWNQAFVTGLSIPITGVKKGTKYFVQVRPVGKYEYGPYSTAKSIVFSPLQNYSVTKTTVTLSNKTNGINATWKPVNGAGKYIVYFKSASAANWSSVETAKNTFLLTNTVKGLRYYVQVQPVINYALGAYSSPVSIVR